MIFLRLAFLLTFASPALCWATPSMGLMDLYQKALLHESVEIEKSRLKQLDHEIDIARAELFPRIQARGSYLTQQNDSIFQAPTVDRNRKSFQVELVQPLYRGGREFAARKAAEGEKLAQMASLEQSKIEIFSRVYRVFFTTKTLENERENTKELLELSQERVGFLQQRVNIGRSRESELISAKAQMISVRSQLMALDSQLLELAEELRALTGLEQGVQLVLDDVNFHSLVEMESYLKQAFLSPWVQSERWRVEAQQQRVKLARAEYFPEVDVRANYYPYREGALEDVDWDVTLNVTIPLFRGGATRAAVQRAQEGQRQAQLRYRLKQREVEESVRATYQVLRQGKKQLSEFQQAVNLNRENYQLLQREYGLGLVSNLDVINALNQYIESRKNLGQLKLSNARHYYELKALTGDIF